MVYIKFVFKLGKTTSVTHIMLQTAFGEDDLLKVHMVVFQSSNFCGG
jgi:hypothetical protein